MSSSVKQQIEAFGAGVFIRSRNVESRLSESDFHRVYSEPVFIWFTPGGYQEPFVGSLFAHLEKFHKIQLFRFPNVAVSAQVIDQIRRDFPKAVIEGVKTGRR